MVEKKFDQLILTYAGESFINNGKPYLMRDAIAEVLAHPNGWEGRITQKLAAGALAIKVYGGAEDYTIEELNLIRERIGEFSPPITAHQIISYLNQ